jgi:hypothetical protein
MANRTTTEVSSLTDIFTGFPPRLVQDVRKGGPCDITDPFLQNETLVTAINLQTLCFSKIRLSTAIHKEILSRPFASKGIDRDVSRPIAVVAPSFDFEDPSCFFESHRKKDCFRFPKPLLLLSHINK